MINEVTGRANEIQVGRRITEGAQDKRGADNVQSKDSVTICDSSTLSKASEGARTIPGSKIPLQTILSKFQEGAQKITGSGADFLDDHITLRGIKSATEQTLKGIKAFPQFIYPSVYKMTPQEVDFVMDVLDKLPLKDVNSVKRMEILPSLPDASGMAWGHPADPYIQLSRSEMNHSKAWAEEVVTHEVGHTKDFQTALFGIFRHESSKNDIWGKPPFISNYAKTNHWEDFAESYANYHLNPERLKAEAPGKFERMQELEKLGRFDGLIDQKAFRETGKYIGKILGKVPYLRTGISLLTYMIGFLQVAHGFGELSQAKDTGDLKKKMDGTLDIAAGTCFATKLFAVPGLAIDGAKHALDRAIDKGEITAAQGNAVIQNTIGVVVGPLGAIANWIKSKFSKKQAVQPQKPQAQPDITLGSLAKAGSIAVGGAAGTLTGGIVGPYMGVMTGFSLAGPLGGAVGLIAGALVGIYAGNRVGGELGSLVGSFFTPKDNGENPGAQQKNP